MFGFFLIPETRGKSADELSHFYRKRTLVLHPINIISTTMNLPIKYINHGTQPAGVPMGITGISLAWAGTGEKFGHSFSRQTSNASNSIDFENQGIDLTTIDFDKLYAPPRYDNTRRGSTLSQGSTNAHFNQGYVD